MRFLVIGAGALGGYFGGRLAAAGEDVTFLVRPRRAAQLEKTGLIVKSAYGDLHLPRPSTVSAGAIGGFYDAVLLGCKAYDLEKTIEDFAPAVGPHTVIVPLLNGLRHIDVLTQRFGKERVLGGVCLISATLDDEGAIEHLNRFHSLVTGELDRAKTARVEELVAAFNRAGFVGRASEDILQEMWEKWVFIASLAGITTLMRASVGDIAAADATDVALALLAECEAIAVSHGHPSGADAVQRGHTLLTDPESRLTASMYKDIERGAPTEADHIIGELLRRAPQTPERFPLLHIVDAHLRTYEAKRARG